LGWLVGWFWCVVWLGWFLAWGWQREFLAVLLGVFLERCLVDFVGLLVAQIAQVFGCVFVGVCCGSFWVSVIPPISERELVMGSLSHVVWKGSGEDISPPSIHYPVFMGSEEECMAYSVGIYNLLIDISPNWQELWLHVSPITDPDWSGALWCVDSGEVAWCKTLTTVGDKNEEQDAIVWGYVSDIVESGDLVDGHPVSSDHALWDECYMIDQYGGYQVMSAWGFPLRSVEGVCVGGLRSI
jgi:hypothetical protein